MEKKKVDPINLKRIVKPKDAKKKLKGIDIEKISGKKKSDTKLILLALSKLLGVNGEETQKVRIPGRRAVYNKRDSRGRILPTMPAVAEREETRVIPKAELPTIVTPGIPPGLYDNRDAMVAELFRLLDSSTIKKNGDEEDVAESPAARAVRLGIYDPHERRYRDIEGVDRLFRNGTGRMVDGGDIVSGLSNLLEQVGLELPELHMPGHSFTGQLGPC